MLSFVAAALPFAIWTVMQVPGEDWWPGAALVYAPKAQWIALPVIGLICAMIAGRPRLRLLNIIAGAFALFALAGFQLNNPPPLPEDRPVIRVATWNVYGWTTERDLVRDRIMSWDCDVVCLQESGGAVFEDLLPGYDSVASGDLRTFVRGEILSTETPRDLPVGPPRMMVTEVETDSGRLTVFNVHIPRTERARSVPRQFRPLIDYIETGVEVRDTLFPKLLSRLPKSGPVVVAGDMNTPPASRYYRRVATRMTDSFDVAGRGFGYTFVWRKNYPILRIDYVWAGGGVDPLRCETRPRRPSDHRPVISTLAMPAQQPVDPR
ncbi:MAG: endonuclease/exonuclease/phosphatase family protein [Armatimonadota bacterium]